MREGPIEDDRLTIACIGALAFILAMLLHEALGHAGVNAMLGERSIIYPVWTQSTSSHALMVAAGPAMNFAAGLALSGLLLFAHTLPLHWRYFLWLSAAFNLLNAAGYLLLGAVSGFGDWGGLFVQWRLSALTRGCVALLAGALYYVFMFVVVSVAGFHISRSRSRRLVVLPYLSAGAVACGAASVSGRGAAAVAVAAAASLGAGIGLMFVPGWNADAERIEMKPVSRSWSWIGTAAAVASFYVAVVGRGLSV